MQFLKPFASPVSVLAPGSCHAERLTASLLACVRLPASARQAGAVPGPPLSPELEAEKQAAYTRERAAWREFVAARDDVEGG
jgi:hypothetical protein